MWDGIPSMAWHGYLASPFKDQTLNGATEARFATGGKSPKRGWRLKKATEFSPQSDVIHGSGCGIERNLSADIDRIAHAGMPRIGNESHESRASNLHERRPGPQDPAGHGLTIP